MSPDNKDTAVIILAGGQSLRAETTKGLRVINNKYWLDILIDYFKDLGLSNIFVGLGYDQQLYIEKSALLKSVSYVINKQPDRGSFSTLQATLTKALKQPYKKYLFIHIDHALPKRQTIEKLLKVNSFDVVKPMSQNESGKNQSGHPIILRADFCQYLLSQPCNSQLDIQIKDLDKNRIKWLEVNDANVHKNLNTQDKWENYKNNIL